MMFNNQYKIINRDEIKYIAISAMFINHIALIFLQPATWLCEILVALGYFTVIAMTYFLVEGYKYTSSKKNYFLRLLIFAFISIIPYHLAFNQKSIFHLNMLFSLLLCFILIWVIKTTNNKFIKFLTTLEVIVFSCTCEWEILAPVSVLLFIWAEYSPKRKIIAFLLAALSYIPIGYFLGLDTLSTEQNIICIFLRFTGMMIPGICITYFYNGQRTQKHRQFSKWFFYIFYPAHLLILGLIRIFIS